MNNSKVAPSLKNQPRTKKLVSPSSPQKNPLDKSNQQIPNSNAFRIRQQIRHLQNNKHRHRINRISENRIEIQIEFQIEKQVVRSGLGASCIFFQQVCEDTIGFIIVLHQMFPWCAPFLLCGTQIMFPRLDDYRDYLQDVLQGEWWPNITAADIIELIPNFITRKIQNRNLQYPLATNTTNTSFDYGKRSYSQSLPHSLNCIRQNCKGLKLCTGQYFNNQEVLVGKYQTIILGMSWSDFVLFKPMTNYAGGDRCYMMKKWSVRQIKKISSKKLSSSKIKNRNGKIVTPQNKQQEYVVEKYQFCVVLVNGRKQYIKIKFNTEENQQEKQERVKQMREMKELDVQKMPDIMPRKKISQKQCINKQGQNGNNINKQLFTQEQGSRADIQPNPSQQASNIAIQQLPQTNPPSHLLFLRHIIQYIQLREWVLGGDVGFQSRIRMLSQIIENSAQLEQQIQLQLYYQCKLKQVINSQYVVIQAEEITSKFQFDI